MGGGTGPVGGPAEPRYRAPAGALLLMKNFSRRLSPSAPCQAGYYQLRRQAEGRQVRRTPPCCCHAPAAGGRRV